MSALELSLAERRYTRRAWPLLSSLRGALRTEHNVRFALLLGSAAAHTPSSDVDVLVGLRDDRLKRAVDLERRLTAKVGCQIDLVRLSDAERDPAVLAAALADGCVLVDRERVWPGLHRREASYAAPTCSPSHNSSSATCHS